MDISNALNRASLSGRSKLVFVATTLALVVGGCASTESVDLEELGLAMEVDIQAGSRFEVAVPLDPDTAISVAAAPRGVTAAISAAPDGESMLLSVAVDSETPRGAYNLALLVIRHGDEHELGWPFSVVEAGAASATEPTATTQPASVDVLLTVASPAPGDLFTNASIVRGETSSSTVGLRLTAGDIVLAEELIAAVDGGYETAVEFTNTCCIEMMLEVFHPDSDGLGVSIPLAYPEPG